MQLSSATFATRKVCKLLLQIARLLSKVKVSKLFSQLFAPIKSVHEESCEKSLQTFTFFATLSSQKKRCYFEVLCINRSCRELKCEIITLDAFIIAGHFILLSVHYMYAPYRANYRCRCHAAMLFLRTANKQTSQILMKGVVCVKRGYRRVQRA